MSALNALACMGGPISAYTEAGYQRKAKMHSSGRAFLRRLADDLGLAKGSYDIRSNKGSIAVSGEVILHGGAIYVQMGERIGQGGGGVTVLYRSCTGRKDYCGGLNNSMTLKQVAGNYPGFVAQCKRVMEAANATRN